MLKFIHFLPVVVGLFVGLVYLSIAHADTSPSWLDSPTISLQREAEALTLPTSLNGNIDCEQENTALCTFPTAYGSADSSGSVELNGTAEYRSVNSYIDSHQHFIGIPNSNTVMTYTTEPSYGFYIYFNYNFSSSITASNIGASTQYQINRPPDGMLADANGNRLAADYTSFSFSENGKWMIVSEPNVAMLRVNLETLKVLPFAPGFNYTIGLGPNPETSISNDGRYAVVASKNFDSFKIYDLNTCGGVPSTISGPVDCHSRDLQNLMTQQVGGYINSSNIRFISNDDLSLYATYSQNSQNKTAKYILSTESNSINQIEYLAMGDSYISGEGAFDYQAETDTTDNRCHLSLVAYPYLIGHDLNYNSYHSVACSGATTNDVINTTGDYSGQATPKVKRQDLGNQLDPILSTFLPGYIDQLDFASTYQPKIITISVGGNDMGFSNIVKSCTESAGTCYGSYEDRLELIRTIDNQVFPKLVQTYRKIKNSTSPDARIYAIGYPQIAKPGGDCALNVHLNSEEVVFSQELVDYLDSVVKTAAAKTGVYYVDTEDALVGHRLCEAKPGSVAVNGVTAGNDRPALLNGPFGDESFHPDALGHELLENKILAETHNLSDSMPSLNLLADLPSESGLDILNAPHTGRLVNVAEYDPSITNDVLYKQSLNNTSVSGANHSLPPSSTVNASLHSDPVSLGSFNTDNNGNLSTQIVIPDSVPAGYHTLHLYSTDTTGQPIDIYKIVYIADSPSDWDGDGIADSSEACVGVPASGQDADQDGIDDSCDGSIGPIRLTQSPVDSTSNDIIEGSNQVKLVVAQTRPASTGRVLSTSTKQRTNSPTQTQPALYINPNRPDSKILAFAGIAGILIVFSYAAWEFRG